MPESTKSASLSQALNSGVRKYGTAIVSNMTIALKTRQLYGFAPQNVTKALAELNEFLSSFIKIEGEAELARVDEFLFINEVRVKIDLGGMQAYEYVVNLMRDRGVGAFVFKEGIDEKELAAFIDLVCSVDASDDEDPWKTFSAAVEQSSLHSVEFRRYVKPESQRQELTSDTRLLASAAYFGAVRIVDEAVEAIEGRRKANLKRLKRVIQAIVDLVMEEESTLLGLVNIRDFGSPLASHAVNVAVLSIALGAKLGFSKKHLGDLGVAALLHDVGKFHLSPDLKGSAPETLSREQRNTLREHVYNGVDVLLGQRISDAVVKSMNVAFLHHFRFDGTGFPRTQIVSEQNVYSRIIAVANAYDNLSRFGPDGAEPMSADQIVRHLMDGGGTEFDPLVVKAFSNLVGLYPVGCVVCLDSGEIGSVVAAASNPRYLDRPKVRLFKDAMGLPTDEVVDLLERDPSGGFPRSILKLYQQEEIQLEMDEFLSVI